MNNLTKNHLLRGKNVIPKVCVRGIVSSVNELGNLKMLFSPIIIFNSIEEI
jgi:hypothetical protein